MDIRNLKFQSYKNLSVVQFTSEQVNTFEYISLSNALRRDLIEVKEISESGSVNDLLVFNKSDNFVFLSDGDILSGAKQNRVLNTSVLIEPNSKTVIPVSCIEAGRWRRTSEKFSEEDYVAPSHLRSGKAKVVKENLKSGKIYAANQAEIWKDVSNYELSYNSFSSTSNLSDLFYENAQSFDEFIDNIKIANGSNGISIFNNNKLINLEIFNRCDIYDEYFSKLLKGNCLELFRMKEKPNSISEAEAFYKTNDFLDKFDSLNIERYKGVGVGEELRFDTEDMTGFELRCKNNLIHLTALNLKK